MAESELPNVSPEVVHHASVAEVMEAIQKLDDLHREPLLLFHVENNSYKEIAQILEIPIGTVMSRISRGREQLYRLMADRMSVRGGGEESIIVSMPKTGTSS